MTDTSTPQGSDKGWRLPEDWTGPPKLPRRAMRRRSMRIAVVCLALVAGWVRHEIRIDYPLVDLRLAPPAPQFSPPPLSPRREAGKTRGHRVKRPAQPSLASAAGGPPRRIHRLTLPLRQLAD